MRIHDFEVKATSQPSPVAPDAVAARRKIIGYGGQQFNCSTEMAEIFLKHAREVIESGDQQLVPLLHSEGIELLLISRLTPYSLIISGGT
ncbi:MAG: hypothetical protein ABIW32_01295 [Terrimesophilobacter sp.]